MSNSLANPRRTKLDAWPSRQVDQEPAQDDQSTGAVTAKPEGDSE
ncbi:hypothetical protein SMC26_04415 [Actinomadura fulvescens]|uniref:Uncharacterized protein n=1 Tax=Actinomadura fulvescens TaxID=46160 RepID=A0ABN3PR79_9ACTN